VTKDDIVKAFHALTLDMESGKGEMSAASRKIVMQLACQVVVDLHRIAEAAELMHPRGSTGPR